MLKFIIISLIVGMMCWDDRVPAICSNISMRSSPDVGSESMTSIFAKVFHACKMTNVNVRMSE